MFRHWDREGAEDRARRLSERVAGRTYYVSAGLDARPIRSGRGAWLVLSAAEYAIVHCVPAVSVWLGGVAIVRWR